MGQEYRFAHVERLAGFGECIWLARLERGLSLTSAAELSGVDKNSLHRIEVGRQLPQPPTIKKLSSFYGIPVRDLLDRPVDREAAV
jgi:transcriptional regulator with XRE-family HTH domain